MKNYSPEWELNCCPKFQFSIRAEYSYLQGGYQGTFYDEPIPLEDMYTEGEDECTFRVLTEVDDATVPLEYELRGEWLYD